MEIYVLIGFIVLEDKIIHTRSIEHKDDNVQQQTNKQTNKR